MPVLIGDRNRLSVFHGNEFGREIHAGPGGEDRAVFLDAGNIWLLEDDESRPGGQLKMKNFLNELALGTGVGLRMDMTMLVLRADLGIGLHAPYDTGKSGYFNIPSFKDGLAFHLAIGYPF